MDLGPHLIVFQDTETTELTFNKLSAAHPEQPNVCEFAFILLDRETLKEVDREQYYVRPHIAPKTGVNWVIHPNALAVHKLTVEFLEQNGVDVKLPIARLWQFADAGVPMVGHNAQFEMKMDRIEIHQAGGDKNAWFEKIANFCTMRACKGIVSPTIYNKREKCLARFGLSCVGTHGALGDAEDGCNILRALKKHGVPIEFEVHYARPNHPALLDAYQTSKARDPSVVGSDT
jgi:DNA polymerase III epsilon subunit-like protein